MPANHPNAGIAANMDIKTHVEFKCESWEEVYETFCELKEKRVAPDRDDGWHFSYELGSNVYMRMIGSGVSPTMTCIEIVLYNTGIVRYYPDDTFTVANGGYNTRTTSQRINQFTPKDYFFYHEKKKLVGGPGAPHLVHNIQSKIPIKREEQ